MIRRQLWSLAALVPVVVLMSALSVPLSGQRGGGAPPVLPDGPGKAIVEMNCTRCHALNMIVNDGYSRQEWQTVFNTMVDLPKDEAAVLADYLARNYPERPKPPAVVLPGPARVSFKEWPLPTKGSRPHDPLATPDGALWYTGMFANKLGRVDTRAGTIKEYPVPPDSGPHGLVADTDGNIWYTANQGGDIGKLDPKT